MTALVHAVSREKAMNRHLTTLLSLAALFVLSTASAEFSHAAESWPTIAVPEIASQPKKVTKVHAHRVQKTMAPNKGAGSESGRLLRVVIQVTQNDPALMRTALNNAENLTSYFQKKGERVQIEIVAYGAGLHMLRSDTSPVLDRIRSFAQSNKQITFSGCENTLKAQSKQEQKDITLV